MDTNGDVSELRYLALTPSGQVDGCIYLVSDNRV